MSRGAELNNPADSVSLLVAPLFHVAGLGRLIGQLMVGGACITLPQFRAELALAARVRGRTTAWARERQALTDERTALAAFAPLFAELEALIGETGARRLFTVHLLRLRGDGATTRGRRVVRARTRGPHELRARTLPDGERAMLLRAADGLELLEALQSFEPPALRKWLDDADLAPR